MRPFKAVVFGTVGALLASQGALGQDQTEAEAANVQPVQPDNSKPEEVKPDEARALPVATPGGQDQNDEITRVLTSIEGDETRHYTILDGATNSFVQYPSTEFYYKTVSDNNIKRESLSSSSSSSPTSQRLDSWAYGAAAHAASYGVPSAKPIGHDSHLHVHGPSDFVHSGPIFHSKPTYDAAPIYYGDNYHQGEPHALSVEHGDKGFLWALRQFRFQDFAWAAVPFLTAGMLGYFLLHNQLLDQDAKLDKIVDTVDIKLEYQNDELDDINASIQDVNEAIDDIEFK